MLILQRMDFDLEAKLGTYETTGVGYRVSGEGSQTQLETSRAF